MPAALLNDVPLTTSPDVGWKFTTGVRPYQRKFRVSAAGADKLAQVVGDVTLTIGPTGKSPLVVKKLSILSIQPTNNPAFREVLVSDLRWRLNRQYVVRQYNVPRHINDFRRLQQEGVPVQIQQVVQELGYAIWSLYPRGNPSQRWTPVQVVDDVLAAVLGSNYAITFASSRAQTVIDFRLQDPGDVAIARALELLPGSAMKVDKNGFVTIFDTLDGGENALIAKGPVFSGPALAARIDLKRSRPLAVYVLFDREIELRFDSEDEGSLSTVTSNARTIENVGPVPDVVLSVGGALVATGTWERFEDLFPAWAPPPAGKPAISHKLVQQRYLSARMIDAYARPAGATQADPVWAGRMACVMDHYLKTYRIARRWLDRIRTVQAYRVGVIDPNKGTRARAQVFSDWAVIPTPMGRVRAASEGDSSAMWNVYGYPTSGLLKDAKVAPAVIRFEDSDQGIFTLNFKTDLYGEDAKIVPSACVGVDGTTATLPSTDLRRAQKGRGEGLLTVYAQLKPKHKIAVVLTVTPGAPNDERVCHQEIVTPSQASSKLGINVGPCNGPAWTIHVGAQILPARHEWEDTLAAAGAIDEAFGLVPRQKAKDASMKLGQPANWKIVREIAEAAAAALYASMIDRPEGSHNIRFDGSLLPQGVASIVEHKMDSTGTPRTIVTFPTLVYGVDVFALLPESVRQAVLRPPVE